MDDTAYRVFFEQPTQTYHHRYEALRAVFVDQRSQKEVAEEFGFTYGSMRQLVFEFRQYYLSQSLQMSRETNHRGLLRFQEFF